MNISLDAMVMGYSSFLLDGGRWRPFRVRGWVQGFCFSETLSTASAFTSYSPTVCCVDLFFITLVAGPEASC